jgi:superfamily I DNA/RNA helicase
MSFPDENQKKVIEHKGRPLVVIAGPGTGKTKTIIHRMIKLLDENPNREVSFITFTRTSRRDTYKKVKKEVCKEAIEKKSDFPRVSTLHTYAKSLVHKFANVIHRNPHFSVLVPEKEDLILLSELIEDLEISTDVKRLRWDISYHCNTERWPEDCRLPETKRHEVLQYFDTLLRFYNCFGMQELVKCACEIL